MSSWMHSNQLIQIGADKIIILVYLSSELAYGGNRTFVALLLSSNNSDRKSQSRLHCPLLCGCADWRSHFCVALARSFFMNLNPKKIWFAPNYWNERNGSAFQRKRRLRSRDDLDPTCRVDLDLDMSGRQGCRPRWIVDLYAYKTLTLKFSSFWVACCAVLAPRHVVSCCLQLLQVLLFSRR